MASSSAFHRMRAGPAFPGRTIHQEVFARYVFEQESFSSITSLIRPDQFAYKDIIFIEHVNQTIYNLEQELKRQQRVVQERLNFFFEKESTTDLYEAICRDQRRKQKRLERAPTPYPRQTSSIPIPPPLPPKSIARNIASSSRPIFIPKPLSHPLRVMTTARQRLPLKEDTDSSREIQDGSRENPIEILDNYCYDCEEHGHDEVDCIKGRNDPNNLVIRNQ